MKRNKKNKSWSALFTGAVMLIAGMPAMAGEAGTFQNGISLANGYVELEAPEVIYNDGTGAYGLETDQAYAIENAGELAWFVRHFYLGDLETQNVCLTDDIDVSALTKDMNLSWTPLGCYDVNGLQKSYDGYFDGNGFSITGIMMDRYTDAAIQDMIVAIDQAESAVLGSAVSEDVTALAYPGIFGYIGENGVVQELCVKDASVTGNMDGTAILAGKNSGVIRSCLLMESVVGAYGDSVGVADFCVMNEGVIESSFSDIKTSQTYTAEGQPVFQIYVPGYLKDDGTAVIDAVFTQKKESGEQLYVEQRYPEVQVVDFAAASDGSVTWELNQLYPEAVYQQQLGTDMHPMFIGDTESPWYVYRLTLDNADKSRGYTYTYCNKTVPESVFADGTKWVTYLSDGTAIDVYPGMEVTSDLVLVEAIPVDIPTDPETTAPPVTDPPVTEPPVTEPPVTEPPVTEPPVTEPQLLVPPYTVPTGLTGYVTYPLSTVALPANEYGYFAWQTENADAELLPTGTSEYAANLMFVPYDTSIYQVVYNIPAAISLQKLDITPHTTCPDTLTLEKGNALSALALPEGWSWLMPECVPETTGTEYTAVYTYADPAVYNEVRHTVVITLKNPVPTSLPDAVLTSENKGENGWYKGDAHLQAPEGCVISTSQTFDNSTVLTITGEGKLAVSYYLKHLESGFICPQKQVDVWIDRTAPTITGVTNGQTYCGSQQVSFADNIGVFAAALNGQPTAIPATGVLTIQPAAGTIQIAVADAAGNVSGISIQVNDGHSYQEGVCSICSAADPNYRKPPVVSSSVADASLSSSGRGKNNWYRVNTVTLTAPTGYRIADHDNFEEFGSKTTMTFTLKAGSNSLNYYLLSNDDSIISTQKSVTVYCDTTAPSVSGLTNAAHYCAPVTFTINEENLDIESCSLSSQVTANADGSFTAAASNSQQVLVLRDMAGNSTTLFYTVHNGHTYQEGVCTYCGAEDENYVAPPTVNANIPDAVPSTLGRGQEGWYRVASVALKAPTGYYISRQKDVSQFGTAASLVLELTQEDNTFTYYLLSSDGTEISNEKSVTLHLDTTMPQVTGIENGKTYCGPVTFQVTDAHLHLASSILRGEITANADGSYTAAPSAQQQLAVLRDLAGNTVTISYTVKEGHSYQEGTCTVCGAVDESYVAPPQVSASIPDAAKPTEYAGKNNWYRTKNITITAPEGYYISAGNDPAQFGNAVSLEAALTSGENRITYYLLSTDGTRISNQKTMLLYADTEAPVITGLEENKVYCESRRFRVTDNGALDVEGSDLSSSIMFLADGDYLAAAAEGLQTVTFRDMAGNETTVHITVNSTHTYESGVCMYCGSEDANYIPPTSISADLPDAQISGGQIGAGGWYKTGQLFLNAPEGFYISDSSDAAGFGTNTVLPVSLQEGEHEISYYVMKKDGSAISTCKQMHLAIDLTAPVIAGAVEGATYCSPVVLTVTDVNLERVTVNGVSTALSEEGTITVSPGSGVQTITAVDAADNQTVLTITVNNGHSYLNGSCTVCGAYDSAYGVNVDAYFLPQNLGNNGWFRGTAALQAPEGFYISFVNNREGFGTNTFVNISEEGSRQVTYYLMNCETGAISQQKSIALKLDKTAPVINNLTNNGIYCLPNGVTYTITEENLASITLNNSPVTLAAESKQQTGSITAAGIYTIKAEDFAGNTTTVTVNVKADHSWDAGTVLVQPALNQVGQRKHICTVCAAELTVEVPALQSADPVPSGSDSTPAGTLAMPTTGNQVNQILGIDDPSGMIGMVLIGLGVVMIGALVGLVVLMKRRK